MSRHEVKVFFRINESVYSSVEFLGGKNHNGSDWKISIESAIDGLLSNKWEFYIIINGCELNIVVQKQSKTSFLAVEFPVIGHINIDLINLSREYD